MGRDIPDTGSGLMNKDREREVHLICNETILNKAHMVWKACFGKNLGEEIGWKVFTDRRKSDSTVGSRKYFKNLSRK